jgi:hypothetical protein
MFYQKKEGMYKFSPRKLIILLEGEGGGERTLCIKI